MPKKSTKPQAGQVSAQAPGQAPGQAPAQEEAVQPGMSLQEIREAVQQGLSQLEQETEKDVSMVQETFAKAEAEFGLQVREAGALLETQRNQILQQLDAAEKELSSSMATMQAATAESASGESAPEGADQGVGACDQAHAEAEQAVAAAVPAGADPQMSDQTQMQDQTPSVDAAEPATGVEGLDGHDPVAQCDADMTGHPAEFILSGDSHVVSVHRQLLRNGGEQQDNA